MMKKINNQVRTIKSNTSNTSNKIIQKYLNQIVKITSNTNKNESLIRAL